MKTNLSPQATAATALVQLVTEHPELSAFMSWSILRSDGAALTGCVHEGGLASLDVCQRILGGSVKVLPAKREERGDLHILSAVWRDVQVEVLVSVPVAAEAVAA